MRVRILDHLCQGHGMCRLSCPEVFQLSDEDGHAYVLDENVPPKHQSAVQQAELSCPEQAIKISDVSPANSDF